MGKKKIRRKFVCISSCTLALNVGGFSGLANVHFGCELLSLKEHTHARTLPPWLFLPFFFFVCLFCRCCCCRSGGFNVFPGHSSSECKHKHTHIHTHTHTHTQSFVIFSLDWNCRLQVVGSGNCAVLGRELQTLRAHRFEDCVETKPAL